MSIVHSRTWQRLIEWRLEIEKIDSNKKNVQLDKPVADEDHSLVSDENCNDIYLESVSIVVL